VPPFVPPLEPVAPLEPLDDESVVVAFDAQPLSDAAAAATRTSICVRRFVRPIPTPTAVRARSASGAIAMPRNSPVSPAFPGSARSRWTSREPPQCRARLAPRLAAATVPRRRKRTLSLGSSGTSHVRLVFSSSAMSPRLAQATRSVATDEDAPPVPELQDPMPHCSQTTT
jgi:hypothetical protein